MLRLNLWPKSKVGYPLRLEINKMREKFRVQNDVTIGQIPKGANMYTGVEILEGALVLSPSHLEFIRFSLHPLFHLVLNSLNLHPMQLNPNSYLLISCMLAVGLKWGVSLGFVDSFTTIMLPSVQHNPFGDAHERIQWLNHHLVDQDWDVQYFLDPNTLLHISQDRHSIIYPSYLRVELSADLHETELVGQIVSFDRVLQFEEDSSHRLRRSYAERQT
ncbi:hypothetical protein L3X38_003926 [Prunus dulcis]|uniref:Uncharacterized protein n=1 Tax=Prunus dulcis TaxID=3755 RepID=A0AAD5F2S7_PRUDU|nr:hypothetical protein L3X38_003926 [Prunus dulcis]